MFLSLVKTAAIANVTLIIAGVAHLRSKCSVVTPLPAIDPIWSSEAYGLINPLCKPCLNDLVFQRIPANSVRPELLGNQEKLTQELCRGIWSGVAYMPQRLLLTAFIRNTTNSSQLWEVNRLASADYKAQTKITNMFEVLSASSSQILLRVIGSENPQGLRERDGLLEISTKFVEDDNAEDSLNSGIEISIKSCFVGSTSKAERLLHLWYARALLETGSWKLLL